MNSYDLIEMGIRNLWRRKLRTSLTILGVVIGTAAIIVMISLGIAISENFKNEIAKLGSLNIITIAPPFNDNIGPGRATKKSVLDEKTLSMFSQIPHVESVTPILETNLKFVSGKNIAYLSVRGIMPSAMEVFDFKIEEGRLLKEDDLFHTVYGSNIAEMFYNPNVRNQQLSEKLDVLNAKMLVTSDMSYGEKVLESGIEYKGKPPKPYKITGVGILNQQNSENDYYVFMPIEQLKKIMVAQQKFENAQSKRSSSITRSNEYTKALVKIKNIKNVLDVQENIKNMGFQVYSLADFLQSMEKTSASMQGILGAIGAVSLLIAAIGITNTMIMSVNERIREIGIMKVIGASLSDIKKLFLFEAAIIGLMGGIIGVLMSLLISWFLNYAGVQFFNFYMSSDEQQKISIIPVWLSSLSLLFTTLIGVLSGYFPAKRAMKISALNAIKTE